MSGDKEDKDSVTLTVKVPKTIAKRLMMQLDFLRELKIPELRDIQSMEDLVVFYIEQLTMPEEEMSAVNKIISDTLDKFSERGITMKSLLNAFTRNGHDLLDDMGSTGWVEEEDDEEEDSESDD